MNRWVLVKLRRTEEARKRKRVTNNRLKGRETPK